MVFKKLLSSLGFGGVDVDTVLSAPVVTPGGPLSGQVHLRAKGDVEITSIQLLLICSDGRGELELARFPVAGVLRLSGGSTQAVPFTVTTPAAAPFNLLYGQQLPGYTIGVRTEMAVSGGSAKTDFDPVTVDAPPVARQVVDALGTIGCRFVRNELRHGSVAGLPVPAAQAVTFWAPLPAGQQPGPHVPQLTFNFAADETGTTVVAELTDRPGQGEHHRVTADDAARLSADEEGWVVEVDGWVRQVLEQLSKPSQAPAGSFLQPTMVPPAAPQHGPQQPY
uniref:sporulation protein n=1 Tax=Allorhizocola rhizosphaerae TaxID=1872709 RepID=UPI000E3E550B